MSWLSAVKALKKTGGWMHIHGNVDVKKNSGKKNQRPSSEWTEWGNYAKDTIRKLLEERGGEWSVRVDHIEYVKSYGPRVDHLVLDLECRPVK